MAKLKKQQQSTHSTLLAARRLTRRMVLKAAAATGLVVGIGPWPVKNALSSSGELNWFTWDDYNKPPYLEDFTKETGIKLNVQVFPGNEDALNKMRTSTEGIDVASPGLHWVTAYVDYDLVQPLESSRIPNINKMVPALRDRIETLGAVRDGKTYAIPLSWSTEALVSAEGVPLEPGKTSYGIIWDEQYKGKMMCRARSVLTATGLWMESTGKMAPGSMRAAYTNEDAMRKSYGQVLDYAIAHKSQIVHFWKGGADQKAGLLEMGAVIGLAWDSVVFGLQGEGHALKFGAPSEGALTVMDSNVIVKGAKNIEQAYALINWALKPETGALMTNNNGYNSVSVGSEQWYSDSYKKFFAAAYPGDAVDKLFIQGPETSWFIAARQAMADKLLAA